MSAYYLKREPLNFGSLFDFIADGFFLCSEAGFVVGYGKGQKKAFPVWFLVINFGFTKIETQPKHQWS